MMRHYLAFLTLAAFAGQAGFAQSVTLNSTPSGAVGQPQLFPLSDLLDGSHVTPNLVEGRELYAPYGMAFDTSVSPPIIYVADTGNNRVLAWKNSTGFNSGQSADLVIGQTDQYSTGADGSGPSSGLSAPTGLAVDKSGNLYVADSGNNRILRYPQPFSQAGQFPLPDLVLGQPCFSSSGSTCRTANYTGALSATGIYLATSSPFTPANIALDSTGNVWITDPGNRRVLEFRASDVAGGGQGIVATVVLGQPSLTTQYTALNTGSVQAPLTKSQFAIPSAIAFDNAGRLYVSDSDGLSTSSRINRVLVFDPKNGALATGRAADRIMGGGCLSFGYTSCSALGTTVTSSWVSGNTNFPFDTLMYFPEGIFFLPPDGSGNQSVGVVDFGYNRILIFPAYALWPAESSLYSPEAISTPIGQNGFTTSSLNPNGNTSPTVVTPPATAASLAGPRAALFLPSTNELFVSDSGNNRVIVMPQSASASAGFGSATRALGQDRLTGNSINLIEGKEFNFALGGLTGAGIALDTSGSVPHLYVADPNNHRVLAFYDIRKIAPGEQADLVIGQQDGFTALCNYLGGATSQGGASNQMTSSSLCYPGGVLVDAAGNLYVADTGNGRVLRFPTPFGACSGGPGSPNCTLASLPAADLVLGQSNFNIKITDPSSTSMYEPYGLAFSGSNGLLVSDLGDSRVLYFPFNDTVNHTFKAGSNGLAATKVYGQPDFVTITTGTAYNQLNGPHGISSDSDGQLYVADSGNNRVLIFPDPNNTATPAASAQANLALTCSVVSSSGNCSTSLSTPRGVFVNSSTGEIWVTDSGHSICVRFPNYDTLITSNAPTGTVQAYGPLALAQDQYGDLLVADTANRVSIYYQGTAWQNDASYFTTGQTPGLAPGSVVALYPVASPAQFGSNAASFSGSFPMAISLGGVEVLVNTGTPAQPVYTAAPLYFVSPGQINFVLPTAFPATLPASTDIKVVQQSTGQILGAGNVLISSPAPGIFMEAAISSSGYQAAVVNQDGSVNSQSNPALRGQIISIYATGQGILPGGPPDGTPPSGLVSTPQMPQVLIGSNFVDGYPTLAGDQPVGKRVQFSGLSPAYPGLWQINVYVPMSVPPSTSTGATPLDIVYNNVPAWSATSPYKTYIWVK
jgi:uncharacterized protein (TIGR03437 family)